MRALFFLGAAIFPVIGLAQTADPPPLSAQDPRLRSVRVIEVDKATGNVRFVAYSDNLPRYFRAPVPVNKRAQIVKKYASRALRGTAVGLAIYAALNQDYIVDEIGRLYDRDDVPEYYGDNVALGQQYTELQLFFAAGSSHVLSCYSRGTLEGRGPIDGQRCFDNQAFLITDIETQNPDWVITQSATTPISFTTCSFSFIEEYQQAHIAAGSPSLTCFRSTFTVSYQVPPSPRVRTYRTATNWSISVDSRSTIPADATSDPMESFDDIPQASDDVVASVPTAPQYRRMMEDDLRNWLRGAPSTIDWGEISEGLDDPELPEEAPSEDTETPTEPPDPGLPDSPADLPEDAEVPKKYVNIDIAPIDLPEVRECPQPYSTNFTVAGSMVPFSFDFQPICQLGSVAYVFIVGGAYITVAWMMWAFFVGSGVGGREGNLL